MDSRKFGGLGGEPNLSYLDFDDEKLDMTRTALDYLPVEEFDGLLDDYGEFETPDQESPSWLQHMTEESYSAEDPDMEPIIQQGGNIVLSLMGKVGKIYRAGVNLLQFEPDEIVSDFVMNGTTLWRVAMRIPKESRKTEVFVALPIINGQFEPPENFMDNLGNQYPISKSGMQDYLGGKHAEVKRVEPSLSKYESFPWERNRFQFPAGEGSAGFLSVGSLEKLPKEFNIEGEDDNFIYVSARLKTGVLKRYAVDGDKVIEISSTQSDSFIKRVGTMHQALKTAQYIEDHLGELYPVVKVYGVKEVYGVEDWIELIASEGIDVKWGIRLYSSNVPCMVDVDDGEGIVPYDVTEIKTVMSND